MESGRGETAMTDEKREQGGKLKDLFPPNPHPPGTVFKPTPPKKRRRRKGQLNDGEWAPDAKAKPEQE
jgi:hypothetical protein